MNYIDTDTLEYPVFYSRIINRFRNTSFPKEDTLIPPQPYASVQAVEVPLCNPITQQVVETAPTKINGLWTQTWLVINRQANQQERDAAIAAATNVIYLNTQASIISAVQARLDAFAQTKFYDGILSACTYATSSVPKFALEGQYAISARDATWNAANSILEAAIAGTRPVPSGYAEIEGELPVLAWPVVP